MPRILPFIFLQIVVLIKNSQAQVTLSRSCPNVEIVNNFDVSKYVGLWYEYSRYSASFESYEKCVTSTYTANPDGSIDILNEYIDVINGDYKSTNETATFVGPPTAAILSVELSCFPGPKGKYWVLGTDYVNYSVVWACNQNGGNNTAFARILIRDKIPSEEALKNIYLVMNKNKIEKAHFTKTEQRKCDRKK